MSGKLFLLPNSLGNSDANIFLPPEVKNQILVLKHLIVENIRNARRYLKSLDKDIDIDCISFYELNKHTDEKEISSFLIPAIKGMDCGILSEAGLPGIADPGASVVRLAHRKNIKVVPLTGPSSIFLTLMASGMNGQSFRFCGYLPVKTGERSREIKNLENKALKFAESQIFIETPYRNMAMLEDIISCCNKNTLLTIRVDLTTPEESVMTKSVGEWQKKKPELHKHPAVFIIGR